MLPVKIWHGFELLSMRTFPVDPNGLVRTGCKHGWLRDHFVDGLGKDE